MTLIKLIAAIKFCLFVFPYAFYKATHNDALTFKEFVSTHAEEVTGGTFAGATGIFEIFWLSKSELHDIYVGILKALIMSAVGYFSAWAVKKLTTWIKSKSK